MKFTIKVWRQANADSRGSFEKYAIDGITAEMSFFEMLDKLNENLICEGKEPIAFDNDCREGICGTCCAVINGRVHGDQVAGTLCQLHMRSFSDGDTIVCEPIRARAFRVIRDLVVDRSALDKIIESGGYISVNTGGAPDANALPVPKVDAEKSMDAASCIGCGACVAACPNSSAMLFTSAKVSHLSLLPQGRVEWKQRVQNMVGAMDSAGFGNCTNEAECEAECPKEIKLENIARMNRQLLWATLTMGE